MRKTSFAVATVLFSSLTLIAPPAFAGSNIAFFWNSEDHDAEARFRHLGDEFDLCKRNVAKVYIDYINKGVESRAYYDGALDTCRVVNENFQEGTVVKLQVCEEKTLAPDDCSNFREGVA